MWWFLVVVILLVVAWIVWVFNGLVVLKNRVNEAWSDIEVQLKRRHNLIPNLVNVVKGYAQHESTLFEKVTQARADAIKAGGVSRSAQVQAENTLSSALKSLFAVAENYPELKANQNFLELQRELSDTEDKIMSARRFYNMNVRDYNTRRETFPNNLFAQSFGFGKRELFEVEEATERKPVEVKF